MKTKASLLLFMFTMVNMGYAQFPSSAYYVFMGDNYGHDLQFGSKINMAQVKSYDITYQNEKGKIKRKFVYQLNRAGNTTYQAKYNKKGTLKRSYLYSYINDTLFESRIILNKKGDTISKYVTQYELGKITRSTVSSGKKTWEYLYTYDNAGNRTSYTYNRKGKTKLTVKYEYDNNNKLLKQLTYNGKNKLTHIINYECNYQGQVEKRVDQSKICIRKDALPNGGYLVYNDYTKPNGKIIRNVSTYNSDSNLVQVQSYSHKNILLSTSKYLYDHDGNCTQHDYTIKNVNFISTYRYNSKKLLEEYTNKKHQQVYNLVKYTYVYR